MNICRPAASSPRATSSLAEPQPRRTQQVQRPRLLRPVAERRYSASADSNASAARASSRREEVLGADAPRTRWPRRGRRPARGRSRAPRPAARRPAAIRVRWQLLERAHREHEREVVAGVRDLAPVADLPPDREGRLVVGAGAVDLAVPVDDPAHDLVGLGTQLRRRVRRTTRTRSGRATRIRASRR